MPMNCVSSAHALSKLQVINKGQISREISKWDQSGKHGVRKERRLCQSELSFDKVQLRQCNQSRQSRGRILKGRDPPDGLLRAELWENVRCGHCLATVAPNRQLDKALWSNLETRSQRILYIGTLLYIGAPLIPTADLPFELATPLRASRRIENGDTLRRPFWLTVYVSPLRHRHLPLSCSSFHNPTLQG